MNCYLLFHLYIFDARTREYPLKALNLRMILHRFLGLLPFLSGFLPFGMNDASSLGLLVRPFEFNAPLLNSAKGGKRLAEFLGVIFALEAADCEFRSARLQHAGLELYDGEPPQMLPEHFCTAHRAGADEGGPI